MRLAVVLVALWLGACAHPARTLPPAAPAPSRFSFVELQPGWRLTVITPLLKSGGYQLVATEWKTAATEKGIEVTAKAAPDFLGYERSVYAIGGSDKGVRVRFASAEVTRDGKTAPSVVPVAKLFQLPRGERRVRLVFLLRSSTVSHNMAVISGKSPTALDALATAIEQDPQTACRSSNGNTCEWIPAGIAVRPEKPDGVNWVPAR